MFLLFIYFSQTPADYWEPLSSKSDKNTKDKERYSMFRLKRIPLSLHKLANLSVQDSKNISAGGAIGIVNAPIAHVAAFIWDVNCPYRRELNAKNDLTRSITEKTGDHSFRFFLRKRVPAPIAIREVCTDFVWKRLDNKRICIVGTPASQENYDRDVALLFGDDAKSRSSQGTVRGSNWFIVLLEDLTDNWNVAKTKITYVTIFDAGGFIPRWYQVLQYHKVLYFVGEVLVYFQRVIDGTRLKAANQYSYVIKYERAKVVGTTDGTSVPPSVHDSLLGLREYEEYDEVDAPREAPREYAAKGDKGDKSKVLHGDGDDDDGELMFGRNKVEMLEMASPTPMLLKAASDKFITLQGHGRVVNPSALSHMPSWQSASEENDSDDHDQSPASMHERDADSIDANIIEANNSYGAGSVTSARSAASAASFLHSDEVDYDSDDGDSEYRDFDDGTTIPTFSRYLLSVNDDAENPSPNSPFYFDADQPVVPVLPVSYKGISVPYFFAMHLTDHFRRPKSTELSSLASGNDAAVDTSHLDFARQEFALYRYLVTRAHLPLRYFAMATLAFSCLLAVYDLSVTCGLFFGQQEVLDKVSRDARDGDHGNLESCIAEVMPRIVLNFISTLAAFIVPVLVSERFV